MKTIIRYQSFSFGQGREITFTNCMNKEITILAKLREVLKNFNFYMNENHQLKTVCIPHHPNRERAGNLM